LTARKPTLLGKLQFDNRARAFRDYLKVPSAHQERDIDLFVYPVSAGNLKRMRSDGIVTFDNPSVSPVGRQGSQPAHRPLCFVVAVIASLKSAHHYARRRWVRLEILEVLSVMNDLPSILGGVNCDMVPGSGEQNYPCSVRNGGTPFPSAQYTSPETASRMASSSRRS
jgi:hypothetical protein